MTDGIRSRASASHGVRDDSRHGESDGKSVADLQADERVSGDPTLMPVTQMRNADSGKLVKRTLCEHESEKKEGKHVSS